MGAALAAASTQRRRHDVLCALGPQAARFECAIYFLVKGIGKLACAAGGSGTKLLGHGRFRRRLFVRESAPLCVEGVANCTA